MKKIVFTAVLIACFTSTFASGVSGNIPVIINNKTNYTLEIGQSTLPNVLDQNHINYGTKIKPLTNNVNIGYIRAAMYDNQPPADCWFSDSAYAEDKLNLHVNPYKAEHLVVGDGDMTIEGDCYHSQPWSLTTDAKSIKVSFQSSPTAPANNPIIINVT